MPSLNERITESKVVQLCIDPIISVYMTYKEIHMYFVLFTSAQIFFAVV